MAEFKILSESEYDKDRQLCSIEVKVDLGDDGVRTYVQDVIFEKGKVDERGQEYADSLESDLKEQQENGTLPPLEDNTTE